jgi:hypothetical protein
MSSKRMRFFRFRLRTLLLVMAVFSVGLSIWHQFQHYRSLAHEHHYLSLLAGYKAMEIQGSNRDRSTMETVYPFWEKSIQHSQLADHYMRVTKRPWNMFLQPPTVGALAPLPKQDAALQAWWQNNVADHVAYNGLESNWGSYNNDAVSNRNLALLNVRPASFNRFLALTHPELFDEP